MKTLKDIFENSVKSFRGKTAYSNIDKFGKKTSISYDDLENRVKKLSCYLHSKLKIKKGDKVAIYSENRFEWVISYMAVVYLGAVAVPIDANYGRDEVDFIVKDSLSKTIIVSSNLLLELLEANEALSQLKHIISFDEVVEKGVLSFNEIIETKVKKDDWNKKLVVTEDDLAVIIYTSGTTGSAKGVLLTHKNIVANISGIRALNLLEYGDKFLSVLPLHHTFEATVDMWAVFSVGGEVMYLLTISPKLIVKIIKKEQINKMIVVPLLIQKIYQNIVRELEKKRSIKRLIHFLTKIADIIYNITGNRVVYRKMFKFLRKKAGLDSIEFFVSGAAPLQEFVAEGMEKLGFCIYQGYGLTEASPVVSVNVPGKTNNKSVGISLGNVSVKIDGADENGIGEIVVKGDNVMKGYYKNQIATDEVLKDGWLYTGDAGYIDKEGFIYITGREKNIIVTNGGKNIFPEEIEEKFLEHTEIGEIAIIGKKVSEKDSGEIPFAFIVPNMDEIEFKYGNIDQTRIEAKIDKIVAKVNSKLLDYKKIKNYKILYEELPKTSTKKVKRFLLKDIAGF